MNYRPIAAALLAAFLAAGAGCGPPGKVEEKNIEVKPNAELEQAKQYLTNYANGQPLGSEVTSFPALVDSIRKSDPTRADILEKGFAELQQKNVNTAAKAKEILKALEPKPTG